ncbi:MAG: SAM-dependent methyltransferase [Nitrospirales bacterium]|nr:SAM-dependent methyltransferase [Nitrospira sp.]MDR4502247.1 SAM-dependent methyltransferase [Nitrospirales bacterium]
MQLEHVVPFGRSLNEYRAMFDLSQDDLGRKILGVGDGPASFNTEMRERGHSVISVDPLYSFTGKEIQRQFDKVVNDVFEQVKCTPSDWVWTYHKSVDDLRMHRVSTLEMFLSDYEIGKEQKRYRIGELPRLPELSDHVFDLALCSHFLFLFSEHFDAQFHVTSMMEMWRVAKEVRVFPLLTLGGDSISTCWSSDSGVNTTRVCR